MASSRRGVIIGAGTVGAHLADELASRGYTNLTVVEQGPLHLPGGSTSCSPDLVFQVNASKTLSEFAKYTVEKLRSLEKDGRSCFDQVGGLEIATTADRLEELKQKHGWATSWGIPARMVDTVECLSLCPLLNKEGVLGGLHTPTDGIASAAEAVQVLVERTRELGVKWLGNTPVIGFRTEDDKVTGVITPGTTIDADFVVSCTGFWGAEVGAMVSQPIPLLPLAHQYVKTTPVGNTERHHLNTSFPALQIGEHNLYMRSHGDRLGVGYYGHRPMPVSTASLEVPKQVDEQHMPSRLPFTSKDFESAWKTSQDLIPALHNNGIAEGYNGVFSFTPDGMPLIGEVRPVDNLYVANGVWTAHSAGVARAVAEMVVEGRSHVDLSACELTRFNEVQLSPTYVQETGQQSYMKVYDIGHPLEPSESARNLRVSPFFARERELGAHFEEWDAWEYPTWYESNAKLLEGIPAEWLPGERDPWAAEHYSPIVAVEAWKTRTAVAMYDMTLLPRIEVTGPGAMELLQHVTSGDVRKKPGAITFALLLDEQGGIRSDITVARLEDKVFQVGANTPVDTIYLERQARIQMQRDPAAWVQVREVTGGTCCIGLWGPYSRDVLSQVTTDDFSNKGLRFFRVKRSIIAGIPVTVMRISYVGELGWEISTSADYGLRLWDTLWKAGEQYGIIAAGRVAFNALRMEKGFKYCGFDMTSEHNPYEAGVGFSLKKGKLGYIGQKALEGVSAETIKRRVCCLTIDDGNTVVLGNEPVFYKDEAVGYVTTAAYGYTIGKPIAFAYLPIAAPEGEGVEIEYFGRRIKATITPEPLFDPQMTRLKDTSSRPAALLN